MTRMGVEIGIGRWKVWMQMQEWLVLLYFADLDTEGCCRCCRFDERMQWIVSLVVEERGYDSSAVIARLMVPSLHRWSRQRL
jgi:hypothetical protein